ncbi:AbrB/MazE/SpoVT family DNA-binding domain-containing protein [Sphingomonas arantia]|uniref:AbrB/MazE/SpoVT family DNA-binding domain-containing protein n=1 Tax=Sphingomonas arantia TaxID=1460676 RepID=A0ABW4TWA3_9SPHN
MNMHTDVNEITVVNMTSKGQVLIPKDVREELGLVPGQPVCVGKNDRGEAVVFAGAERQAETHEERAARIRAAINEIAGKYYDGSQTTDEIMFELRGDRLP